MPGYLRCSKSHTKDCAAKIKKAEAKARHAIAGARKAVNKYKKELRHMHRRFDATSFASGISFDGERLFNEAFEKAKGLLSGGSASHPCATGAGIAGAAGFLAGEAAEAMKADPQGGPEAGAVVQVAGKALQRLGALFAVAAGAGVC